MLSPPPPAQEEVVIPVHQASAVLFCSLIFVFVEEIALGLHLNIPDSPLLLAFGG